MKSSLVYKFTCASCSSSYIAETCRHFNTRIEEHIKKDNKSHIFKHLHSTTTCFDSYNPLCFKIIDKANSKFDLKIGEALQINWRRPDLKCATGSFGLDHFTMASVPSCSFLSLFFVVVVVVGFFLLLLMFAFLFHLLFSLSLR